MDHLLSPTEVDPSLPQREHMKRVYLGRVWLGPFRSSGVGPSTDSLFFTGSGAAVHSQRLRRKYHTIAAVDPAMRMRDVANPAHVLNPGKVTFIPYALVMTVSGRVIVNTTVRTLITWLTEFETIVACTSIRLVTISRCVSRLSSTRIMWS